jgi:hypothetical protein
MKHTNKMVNIESNPVNGSSFMNDLRNKYKEKQTAIDWIVSKLSITFQTMYSEEIEQAKEMYKEQMIEFANSFYDECGMQYGGLEKSAEEYYNETYEK